MRAVNLLPKDAQAGGKSIRQEDPAVVIGSALGVVVMIALVGSFLTAHSKAGAQQTILDQKRIELARLSEQRKAEQAKIKPVKQPTTPITPIVPPPAVTGQEATWLSSVTTVLGQRIAWDRVLREVSQVMPEDVTLSALTMTTPTPAVGGAATAQGFTMTGNAFSYDSVARLLSRLSLVPDLSNVTLANTAAGTGTAGGASTGGNVSFSINAALKGAPAPVAPVVPVAPVTTDTTSGEGA
jgi:Tfp pilus assembly protein PilN